MLVRDPGRLRQLEMARTVVLHPSALRVPGAGADPWTEDVLDAARRAGLRVVMVEDPALADFTGLADQVVGAGRPLADVVAELRAEGGVITVVRPLPGDDGSVSAGLLAGDVAVALADADCPVAWGADVLAPQGLADVWRVLRAVPVSRAVGSRSQTLARSGAALSGLLVAVGEARGRNRGGVSSLLGMRHAPVDASAAVALLSGTRAAIGVAMARAPRPRARVAWHALDPDDVRERLEREREPRPTAVEQAAARLRAAADRAGRVPVLAPVRWSWQLARAVRGELDDPLTPVLAVGSAASAILGSVVDALLVVGALDLNALVGGFQRLRAERALSGLLAEQKQKARVTEEPAGEGQPARDGGRFGAEGEQRARDGGEFAARGGEPRIVDAARLHPGHVIELKADDVVPADARLLWEDGLEVDESALTGESLPVDKCVDPAPRAPVAERYCMVFEGTTVVAGRARAVVVDTGDHTEAARAVALAARTPSAAGVQARLQELTRKALPLTLAGGAAVTGLSLLRGAPIRQAVAGGVSVAVAAVPEGLPLVATVAQLARPASSAAEDVLVAPTAARWRRSADGHRLLRQEAAPSPRTGFGCARVAGLTNGTVRRVGDPETAGTVRVAARACPRLNGDGARPTHATDEAVLDAAGDDPGWTQEEGLPFETSRGYAAAVGREDGQAPPYWWSRAPPRRCCPPAPACPHTPPRWHSASPATDCASSRWRGGPWPRARRRPTSSNSSPPNWSSPDCSRWPTWPARPPRRWCAGCARRAYGPWC
ncbi:Cation-translocating P-type ATPase OS=Streptomyces tendae OX=1932 GN=GUR47_09910 PE=4 SV=1 [Streptomyces tendae]